MRFHMFRMLIWTSEPSFCYRHAPAKVVVKGKQKNMRIRLFWQTTVVFGTFESQNAQELIFSLKIPSFLWCEFFVARLNQYFSCEQRIALLCEFIEFGSLFLVIDRPMCVAIAQWGLTSVACAFGSVRPRSAISTHLQVSQSRIVLKAEKHLHLWFQMPLRPWARTVRVRALYTSRAYRFAVVLGIDEPSMCRAHALVRAGPRSQNVFEKKRRFGQS